MSLFSNASSKRSQPNKAPVETVVAEPAAEPKPSVARVAKAVGSTKAVNPEAASAVTQEQQAAGVKVLVAEEGGATAIYLDGVLCIDGDESKPASGWFVYNHMSDKIREHFKAGLLHAEDGPASIKEGAIRTECYARNGLYHREGAPAIISTHPDGTVLEHYFLHGKVSRKLTRYEDGSTLEVHCAGEFFYWHRHNPNGPAVVLKDKDGKILMQEFHVNGQLHRDNDMPAILQGAHMEWWDHGERHRVNGPAIVKANGEKSYFLQGREVTMNEVSAAALDNRQSTVGVSVAAGTETMEEEARQREMRERVGNWINKNKGRSGPRK